MSFHTGQSFTFGETPSATKWNYLWENDYALADGTGIEDDAISGRQIQFDNNQDLEAKNSGGTAKKVLRLDNDNYLRLSQIPIQQHPANSASNSTGEDILFQMGWISVQGAGTAQASKAVTFPAAFGTLYGICFGNLAAGVDGSPADITEFTVGYGSQPSLVYAEDPTTSGFTANFVRLGGGTLGSGNVFGASYIAFGTKA